MRILQLIDSLDAGGAERMAVQIANEWARAGHQSFLCATRQEGLLKNTVDKDVIYIYASKKSKLDLTALWRIRKFIKAHGINYIHAHSTSFFTAVLVKITLPHLKIIWHDHYGNAENLEERSVFMLALASYLFNGVIAVNESLKLWSQDKLHVKNVCYLRNFTSTVKNEQRLLKNPLPGIAGKRIVHLANLRPQKDHKTLLEAFKIVQGSFPDWDLLLVGHDFNDGYSHELKEWVTAQQLCDKIHFLGSRSDVPAILEQVSIGVLSSLSEGLPVALLEYANAALPVIVTDVGACREVVREYGIVITAGDAVALSDALSSYMVQMQQAKERGIAFKSHVSTTFGSQSYILKLIAFYNSVR